MSTTEIIESVGLGGANRRPDVITVQTLLKSKGYLLSQVDGRCGPATIAAIKKLQGTYLADPDGLVEPGRGTWRRLRAPSGPLGSSRLKEWSGDSARWPQEKKLKSMHPDLRPKVEAIVAALAKQGFKPKIFFGWRSVAVQLEIVKKGHSKVKFSFHNAQKPDGTPNAYAADIVDERWAWGAQAETEGFWKALGEEAKQQALVWGGDWKKFKDVAHVQLVANKELAKVKKESGL